MQNPAIERAVRARAADWRRKLTSLDRRNPTLYFRPLKAGTLQLPPLDSEAVRNLADEGKPLDLATALGVTPDLLKRVLAIRGKARENEEERGIQTMFVALGMAGWKATDGGRDPKAPMFLLPVTVTDTPRGPQIARSGDLLVNRVMLQAWAQDHRLEAASFEDDEPIEGPIDAAFAALAQAGAQLDGFAALRECHLSNFSFAKMAMVEDLKRHEDLLGENRLVLAIAGDPEAQRSIREDAGTVERDQLDAIDPSEELIVLEADEYQRQAIHSLTRFDADGVVDGPPGTGKSQTIANLIATLVGQGKKVLFVAEKRAALDAVRNRLAAAGLADLVLDLHGADTKRRAVYDRLRDRDDKARSVGPVAPNTANRLKQLRSQLNAYYRAINTPVGACGLSPRDLIARLARIDVSARSQTLWYGEACRALTSESHEQAARDVEYLARDPELFRREARTPWARADFADQEDAAQALRFAGETRQALENLLAHLRPVAQSWGADLSTFDDIAHACRAAETMQSVAAVYRPEILDADVEELARDLGPAEANPVVRLGASMFSPKYRAALRAARAVSASQTKPDRLLASLRELQGLPNDRRARALFSICTESYAATARALGSALAAERKAFAAAAGAPLADRVELALVTLRAYEAANRTARRVPDVRRAERDLVAHGYASFVAELGQTAVPPASWPAMLEHAWLRSHLEETKTAQPILGSFSRAGHERTVDEFREIDAKQIELAEATVRRSAAQAYITARNEHPDQATTFRAEVNKKTRHMPVRRLVQRAGDVITGLCPCWMASPLSVSQLIAGRVLFDVVIFDEASQVLPEDAIPSIMRGKRTIVAGDQKQLPPTIFFAASSADGDDDDEADDEDPELVNVSIEGMESILDVMLTFCNRQNLNVHYRSLDESLIRFSNHEFYRDRLVTFPGPGIGDGGIRHVLVDSPFVDGEELSSSAEISRVTDLVLEHAELRPDETLGVIAMGIKHARRLEASIEQQRKLRGDLDEFFAKDDVNRAFFVKNLERVQGDERDAIILSLGYAKDASGRLKNKLSALNHSGGERRLNVAVTRSKTRMTVASTFTEDDMEASRFSAAGAQKLCRFVEYARSGGKKLSDVAQMDVEMNDFERDVFDALTAKGLRLVPQLGVSQYRLDFAVLHPTIPNRYVLAIECDGAPYHSSATARDRDRLRQRHLEAMGWRFHRIWSLDWYEERAAEIARTLAAHAAAIAQAEHPAVIVRAQRPSSASGPAPAAAVSANGNPARGPKPRVTPRDRIADYPESQIRSVLDWIASDGRLRDDDEMLADAVPALGFARRGKLIEDRLRRSIAAWRNGRR